MRWRICPGRVTRPFFIWLQHITTFPRVQTPTHPPDLTVLTPTPNPQNYLPSFFILLPSSLSASFSSCNLSGPGSWWMGPQEEVAGKGLGFLWYFLESQERCRQQQEVENMSKENTEETLKSGSIPTHWLKPPSFVPPPTTLDSEQLSSPFPQPARVVCCQ